MTRTRDLHVIAGSVRGRWYLMRGRRRLSRHRTQTHALTAGRRLARRTRVDLVTHGRNGRIRSKDSYGNESPVKDMEH